MSSPGDTGTGSWYGLPRCGDDPSSVHVRPLCSRRQGQHDHAGGSVPEAAATRQPREREDAPALFPRCCPVVVREGVYFRFRKLGRGYAVAHRIRIEYCTS